MDITIHLNKDYSILVIVNTPELSESLTYATSIHGAAFLVSISRIKPRVILSGFDAEWKNTFMSALRAYSN